MDLLSVVIPSRNEPYLKKTIEDLLIKATGEIEVIAVLEAYWPPVEDIIDDHRVKYLHNGQPLGMRGAINRGVAIAKGRYILKIDAHCMFSKGFDEVLRKEHQPFWVQIPRRYALDPVKWEIEENPKYPVDYMYLSSDLHGEIWHEKNKDPRLQSVLIDDLMSAQGSCWFMEKSYYETLGLLDEESYGTFYNEFQEIGLKTWLYQGKVKVNKKCWYAHWHKPTSVGRGYSLDKGEKEKGVEQTSKWLTNDAWKIQQRQPLSYLIKKFWPVPTWDKSYVDNYEYDYELMFWRKWLGNKGRGAKKLSNPQLVSYFKELIGDKKKVSILDVGGGAIPMYGWTYPGVEVDMHLSDLLADGYPKILKEVGLDSPIVCEKQDMTKMTYPDESFDIVHCRNAWDHSSNPYEALKEMIRVCKKGGWVYLWHYARVAKTHGTGMHNTDIDIKDGRCIIKHESKTFFIDEVDPRFKVSTVEGKHQIIICKLQK